jgi:uncharacterized protein (TIGR03435 family)
MLLSLAATLMAVVEPTAFGQATAVQPTTAQVIQSKPALTFDVVSIKLNKAGSGYVTISFPPDGDGIMITQMSLQSMLLYAYNIQSNDLLIGVPAWAKSDQYDLQAKVADSDVGEFHKLTDAQRRLMLQALLTDSFKMQIRSEPKEVGLYALVVNKNGPKMREVKPGDPHQDAPKDRDGAPIRGMLLYSNVPGQMTGQEVPMGTFARGISGLAGRQVVDETGLTGIYDLTLKWTPEQRSESLPSGPSTAPSPATSGPSIFSALEEQLGLKLESRKSLIPVLVIDHVERPSPNQWQYNLPTNGVCENSA